VSADLYICETTDGVEYYYECRVSLEPAILMGALYQLYKVLEPLVRATIQWTEQGVNGISLVPFVLLQAVYIILPCAHESSLSVSEGWRSGQPHSHCVCGVCSLLIIILFIDAPVMGLA
jgi:hypothetical protein